jgi:hypothetical protein
VTRFSARHPTPWLIVSLLTLLLIFDASPAAASPRTVADASAGRVQQLEQAAIALAVRLRAVPVRDGAVADPGRYCPRSRLAASWTPPKGKFRYGAYVAPLGPRPGPATRAVTGVVVCRGSTYAYMGFDAYWTAGGWRVTDVPVLIDEGRATEPPVRRPSAADGAWSAVGAAHLPSSGPGRVDDLAPYQPQTSCDPRSKPGVRGFRRIVLLTFPATRDLGIVRACHIGGRSEHKQGRAWDWGVRVSSRSEHAAARRVFAWLLGTDLYGRRYAMARRFGVMYMIYNRQIWASYRASVGWRRYVGASAHTDHVHLSFSWAGAYMRTSYWDGSPVHYPAAAR